MIYHGDSSFWHVLSFLILLQLLHSMFAHCLLLSIVVCLIVQCLLVNHKGNVICVISD